MISGIKKICIILEIKSHNTKAGKGSNCALAGLSVFQLSQKAVQQNIIRKNPIVPTWSVIQTATRSSLLRLSLCSIFIFLIGARDFLSSSIDIVFLFSI